MPSDASADRLVRGRFLVDGSPTRAELSIAGGRVVAFGKRVEAPGARVLDYGDRLVLPGAIDAHVHFRDPGHPEKEDFGTGTESAAFGGVTCVLDMPNTRPATITPAAFDDKLARARAKARVDFGLYCGLAGPESLGLLARATAMKVYLGSTTGDLLVTDWDLVERAVHAAAHAGKTIAFHAEDQACLDLHAHDAPADRWESHSANRPPACEAEAILRLAEMERPDDARVHVAHLSTADGLAALLGSGITCEVAPHHLVFTVEDLAKRGGALKMNPPLRAAADAETLLLALASGDVDCVASDHAPHTPGEKERSPVECPSGVPGVETMVPLLLALAKEGRVPFERVQEAACARPAEIFGLPKGRFAPGYDADFAVFDLERPRAIRAADLHSRCGWTPYEGMPAVFPSDVFVRGEPVVEDGALAGPAGRGRFLDGTFRS